MNISSFFSKMFYAILLSPLQTKEERSLLSRSSLLKKQSRYKHTFSVLKAIDRVLPGHADKMSRLMYKNNLFPWTPVDIELTAFGSGTAVFMLNMKNGNKALRIYRKSLGKPLKGLLEIAGHYKKNYQTVLDWYGGSPGIVLPMDFLILYGLPFSNPVVASLQPYIHGQKHDFFEDFSDYQLVEIMKRNKLVREQFLSFAEQTISQWEEQKMCFDFLGKQNLMLIKRGNRHGLCIADVGIFNFNRIAKKYPQKMEKIEQRIIRLVSLYELAKKL